MMKVVQGEFGFGAPEAQEIAAEAFKQSLEAARTSPDKGKFYRSIIEGYQAKLNIDTAENLAIAVNNLAILMKEPELATAFSSIKEEAVALTKELNAKIASMTINLNTTIVDYDNMAVNNNHNGQNNNTPPVTIHHRNVNVSSGLKSTLSKLLSWNSFSVNNNNSKVPKKEDKTSTNHNQQVSSLVSNSQL